MSHFLEIFVDIRPVALQSERRHKVKLFSFKPRAYYD